MLFLPFAHSDFIFAVVSEELGLVGSLAVILVFGLFLWRGVRTELLAPDRFGMLLSFGIVTSIVAQALFNISVVLSMVPTKGIPLPFISYGGSSLVPTLAAVGILLNISQHAIVGLVTGNHVNDPTELVAEPTAARPDEKTKPERVADKTKEKDPKRAQTKKQDQKRT